MLQYETCGHKAALTRRQDMKSKTVIQEAIANIDSTSDALRKYCDSQDNYNTAGFDFLSRVVWELSLQKRDLKEIQQEYGI
jgi:hypothetical protein